MEELASYWRLAVVGWLVHLCIEWAVHGWARAKAVCPHQCIGGCTRSFRPACRPGAHYVMWLFSSGWAAAHLYKGGLCKPARAQYVICCNFLNIIISLAFCVVSLLLPSSMPWLAFWLALCFWRFISRSVEVTRAFTEDALRNPRHSPDRSALHKYARLRLALRSYLEIFLYSAAFYAVLYRLAEELEGAKAMYQALMASFSIGTLTNVGPYVEALNSGYWSWLPFVQVIATLSLVVLSLAMYTSRKG